METTSPPPYYFEQPEHCLPNATLNATASDYEILELLAPPGLAVTNATTECYPHLRKEERDSFLRYEAVVGGYCNCIVGFIGLIGNVLSLIVLSQPGMQRNNCFNKLLIGK